MGQASVWFNSSQHDLNTQCHEEKPILTPWTLQPYLGCSLSCLQRCRSEEYGTQGRIWLVCTSTEEIQEGQSSFLGGQLLFFISRDWWKWRLGRHCDRPYYNNRPQQRWRSSINLIFFRGVSPHFSILWSFDDKGGEIWVSLQAGLLYGRCFLLS